MWLEHAVARCVYHVADISFDVTPLAPSEPLTQMSNEAEEMRDMREEMRITSTREMN